MLLDKFFSWILSSVNIIVHLYWYMYHLLKLRAISALIISSLEIYQLFNFSNILLVTALIISFSWNLSTLIPYQRYLLLISASPWSGESTVPSVINSSQEYYQHLIPYQSNTYWYMHYLLTLFDVALLFTFIYFFLNKFPPFMNLVL